MFSYITRFEQLGLVASVALHIVLVVWLTTQASKQALIPALHKEQSTIVVSLIAPAATQAPIEPVKPTAKIAQKPIKKTVRKVVRKPIKKVVEQRKKPKQQPKQQQTKQNRTTKQITKILTNSGHSQQIKRPKTGTITNKTAINQSKLNAQNKQQKAAYESRLTAHIESYKRYPKRARQLRMQGTGIAEFNLTPHGGLQASRLIKTTGHYILDDEIIATLDRAQPYPKPPTGLKLHFKIPLKFYLR